MLMKSHSWRSGWVTPAARGPGAAGRMPEGSHGPPKARLYDPDAPVRVAQRRDYERGDPIKNAWGEHEAHPSGEEDGPARRVVQQRASPCQEVVS